MKLRKEFDSIGSINVPSNKYWGASTQRSNKFFELSAIKSIDYRMLWAIKGLKTFNSK